MELRSIGALFLRSNEVARTRKWSEMELSGSCPKLPDLVPVTGTGQQKASVTGTRANQKPILCLIFLCFIPVTPYRTADRYDPFFSIPLLPSPMASFSDQLLPSPIASSPANTNTTVFSDHHPSSPTSISPEFLHLRSNHTTTSPFLQHREISSSSRLTVLFSSSVSAQPPRSNPPLCPEQSRKLLFSSGSNRQRRHSSFPPPDPSFDRKWSAPFSVSHQIQTPESTTVDLCSSVISKAATVLLFSISPSRVSIFISFSPPPFSSSAPSFAGIRRAAGGDQSQISFWF